MGQIREIVVLGLAESSERERLAASLALAATRLVVADWTPGASLLRQILAPTPVAPESPGRPLVAMVEQSTCVGCGACESVCPLDAVHLESLVDGRDAATVDPLRCDGCGDCVAVCPTGSIQLHQRPAPPWVVSRIQTGFLVSTGRGATGNEGGMRVEAIRQGARHVAQDHGIDLLVSTGPMELHRIRADSFENVDLILVTVHPEHSSIETVEMWARASHGWMAPTAACLCREDAAAPQAVESAARFLDEQGIPVLGRVRFAKTDDRSPSDDMATSEQGMPTISDVQALWTRIERHLSSHGQTRT